MKKVYIFDLDGTLIDSMPCFGAAMLSILDEEGIKYGSDMLNIVTPLGYTKTAEYYKSLGAKASVEDMIHRIEAKLVYEYTNNIKLKPGVKDYLTKLTREGARLFVLTASPHLVTDVCLKNNGVYELFEEIWSVDDWGLSKSGTELFDKVALKIGCQNSEVHYFDDNLIAVENASKAGYNVYGCFDMHDEAGVQMLKKYSNTFVKTFEDLL